MYMCKYTRIHFGSFCVLCLEIKFLMISKNKCYQNVKKVKAVFYDVMLSSGLINELFYKTLKMVT